MANESYSLYAGAEPYFALIRNALGELVEGTHFFDILATDIVYEVRYDLGWPRVIQGRADLMDQFRGYVRSIRLQSADELLVTRSDNGHVLTIEYDIRGTILETGVKYENRFCSVVEIRNRKVARWRDYMDSHAAWNALTARSK